MIKGITLTNSSGLKSFVFFCPGCGQNHSVIYPVTNLVDDSWDFNGDHECPTISPSIKVNWQPEITGLPPKLCHSYVKMGKIEFQDDCYHMLRNTTVELPEYGLDDSKKNTSK